MLNNPTPLFRYILISFIISFFCTSCEKSEPDSVNMPAKLFRPVQFSAEVNGTEVLLTWVPIKGASYTITIAREGMADKPQAFSFDSRKSFLLENLYSETTYEVTIKAISKIEGIADSEEQQLNFHTGTENIFFEISDANISSNSVIIQWDATKQVSAILVKADGVADRTIDLSPTQITTGEALITGLQNGMTYTFQIYLMDMLRGTISASTREN
ncbi:hypothetical protein SAMN05216436_13026 [bacterium A37T11]|nr:hypothetical protein SAMN05216436_13026 [bacterium A37T11]